MDHPSPSIDVRDLIAKGVHFGHRVSRWNPKTRWFVHGKKNGVHIIDVRETLKGILRAAAVIRELSLAQRTILIVGTKPHLRRVVRELAQKVNMPYVTDRWLGGTLTNFHTITLQIRQYAEVEKLIQSDAFHQYRKKEQSMILRHFRKLKRNLEGIKTMTRLPHLLLVVDPTREQIAVREARVAHIPVLALIDTDGDPSYVDVSVPCNDDSIRVVQAILQILISALEGGQKEQAEVQPVAVSSPSLEEVQSQAVVTQEVS